MIPPVRCQPSGSREIHLASATSTVSPTSGGEPSVVCTYVSQGYASRSTEMIAWTIR